MGWKRTGLKTPMELLAYDCNNPTFGRNGRIVIREVINQVEFALFPDSLLIMIYPHIPTPFLPGITHFQVFRSVLPFGRVMGPAYE